MTNPVEITAPEGLPFVDVVREFEAPAALVWRAWTEPELVSRWLGPRGYEMDIEQWSLVTGGRYRYVHRDPEGAEYIFNGVVHLADPGRVLIQTFEWEGAPQIVSIDTLRFQDLGDGRSRAVGHSVFPSVQARDGMITSGMERGLTEGYRQLDEVLAGLT
ncbi:SRPBCC family protein [uncultured Amnibacterium sp.]|uniref:SRPBCC family protein n=1 Tax=uncultured Amnibacterium sp. TaxID=1631851 RepID=UPI0035CAB085